LNVSDAPPFNVVVGHVKVQWFDVVSAELPEPLSGLSVEPDGTASLVQWSPLGMLNDTSKPVTAEDPAFLIVIVPQYSEPS
jgi:hypothetical protein